MLLNSTEDNLKHCADLLNAGEVVAVPTETVYGLAADALNENAVRKIFSVKGRPLLDPLIVHCSAVENTLEFFKKNSAILKLAEKFWPGPLTIVGNKKSSIPDIITAGQSSVAIRVPSHGTLRHLIELTGKPLAAPSANPFGYVSPTDAQHVSKTLGSKIAAILDDGRCEYGVESTIIDLRDPQKPTLLRQGPLEKEAIEAALGMPVLVKTQGPTPEVAQTAPGMLTKHYSPHAQVHLYQHGSTRLQNKKLLKENTSIARILIQRPPNETFDPHTYWLSETGDMDEVAHNLFALLQKLDSLKYKQLLVEQSLDVGIGLAINDRLRRAAAH
jgi:L-threonylcarbamoyladenylate synthase